VVHNTVVASILAQHTFACALVTRGALCDCHPTSAKPDLVAALAACRRVAGAVQQGQ
jgi:hypothetical protein